MHRHNATANDLMRFRCYGVEKDPVEIAKHVRGGAEGIVRMGQRECVLEITMEGEKEKEQLVYSITLSYDDNGNIMIKGEELVLLTEKRQLTLFERKEIDANNSSLVNASLFTEVKPRFQSFSVRTSILSQIEYVNCVRKIKESVQIVVGNLRKIRLSNPIPERMRDFSSLSKTIADDASNLAGYLANMDGETRQRTYESILRYLRPLPDKDIKSIRAEKVPMTDMAMLYCTEEWLPGVSQEQSARGMSDGTLRFAAKDMVAMLKEIGKQKQLDIICTTHNATFVDELGAKMIPFISYIKRNEENGCTDIRLLEDTYCR